MTRYAHTSFIAGLLLPPLLCVAGGLTFFILCSTVFTSLDTLAYAICGSGGIMLLLAPLAGWRLTAGQNADGALYSPAATPAPYLPDCFERLLAAAGKTESLSCHLL